MTTTQDPAEAQRLARDLVEQRLAACVQVAAIESHYVWEGELEHQTEQLLLIKTPLSSYEQVERFLRQNHSYALPEIAVLPMVGGSPDYLAWLRNSTSRPPGSD
jgi:periplasmic divalent cation tolerance protein